MTIKNVDQTDLTANAHIEAPYTLYRRMHEGSGVVEIGVAVAVSLLLISKNLATTR